MYILLPWGNNHPGTCTGTCIVYEDSRSLIRWPGWSCLRRVTMVALVITRGWARIGGRHLTTAWGKLCVSGAVLMEIDV